MRIESFGEWLPVVEKKIPEPIWSDEGLLSALQQLEEAKESILREPYDFVNGAWAGMNLFHLTAYHGFQKSLEWLRSKKIPYNPLRTLKNPNDKKLNGANVYECALLNANLSDEMCCKLLNILFRKEKDLTENTCRENLLDWTLVHHAIHHCRFETTQWLLSKIDKFKPFKLVDIEETIELAEDEGLNDIPKECAWEMFFTSPNASDDSCLKFLNLFSQKFTLPEQFVSNTFSGANPIHIAIAVFMPKTLSWLLERNIKFDLGKAIKSCNDSLHKKTALDLLFHAHKITEKTPFNEEQKILMWKILLESKISNKKPLFEFIRKSIKGWFKTNSSKDELLSLIRETNKLKDPIWFETLRALYVEAASLPISAFRMPEARALLDNIALDYVSFQSKRENLSTIEAVRLMEEEYLKPKKAEVEEKPKPVKTKPIRTVKKSPEVEPRTSAVTRTESTSPSENITPPLIKKEIPKGIVERITREDEDKIKMEWENRNKWLENGGRLKARQNGSENPAVKPSLKNRKKPTALIASVATPSVVLRKISNSSTAAPPTHAAVEASMKKVKPLKKPSQGEIFWSEFKAAQLEKALDCCYVMKNAQEDLDGRVDSYLKSACNRVISNKPKIAAHFKKGSLENSLHHHLIFLSQQYTLMKVSSIVGYVFFRDHEKNPQANSPVSFRDCREIRNRIRHPQNPISGVGVVRLMSLAIEFSNTFIEPLVSHQRNGQLPLQYYIEPIRISSHLLGPSAEKENKPELEALILNLVNHFHLLTAMNDICEEISEIPEAHFQQKSYLHNSIKGLIMLIGQALRDLKSFHFLNYDAIFTAICLSPCLLAENANGKPFTIFEKLLNDISHHFENDPTEQYALFEDISVSQLMLVVSETKKIEAAILASLEKPLRPTAQNPSAIFGRPAVKWKLDAEPVQPPQQKTEAVLPRQHKTPPTLLEFKW